jgi:arsenate reductase
VLRRKDKAFRELGLSGEEDDATLVALMAEHPTLLQRPIGVLGDRAVVGRPPERLLELVGSMGSVPIAPDP